MHLEVKAQTVKKGKGGWEVPVLEYYKCEEQPEQNVKREAQEKTRYKAGSPQTSVSNA